MAIDLLKNGTENKPQPERTLTNSSNGLELPSENDGNTDEVLGKNATAITISATKVEQINTETKHETLIRLLQQRHVAHPTS